MAQIKVNSPNVQYSEKYIEAKYNYKTTKVRTKNDGSLEATPQTTPYVFRTKRNVPKLGVMLVGWGGNNGSTVTGSILSNKLGLKWNTKFGMKSSNYFGSLTQAGTVCLGTYESGDVYVPLKSLLPMVNPNDIVFDGWDISSMNLGDAMRRAEVFDFNLQEQLYPMMHHLKPRPSIYFPDFIAANQSDRADNVLTGSKQSQMEQIRADIRDFQRSSAVEKLIVLWTANTERFSQVRTDLNDTASALLRSIEHGEEEVSPSTIFAVASILEGVTFINGSPQNTFVPGVIELANHHRVHIGGDDFKSGQTKVKSVLADFLVSAGIKLRSIVSYNHLGNNDGKNLSAQKTFRSKEISKSCVVDDMVASNKLLYPKNQGPDHTVVIKYVPTVGDSKRAMDEYTSEIMMGGSNTIVLHNTCEDSLLAAPLIIDLVVLAELVSRIEYVSGDDANITDSSTILPSKFQSFNPILSILSYLCKAPLVGKNEPVVNALFKQRACIENVLRACIGLEPVNNMLLEYKCGVVDGVKSGDVVGMSKAGVKRPHEVCEVNGVHENGVHINGVQENGHAKLLNGFDSEDGGIIENGHDKLSNGFGNDYAHEKCNGKLNGVDDIQICNGGGVHKNLRR